MSKYNITEELETITKACAAVPMFSNLMFECAWKYGVYDRARLEANEYIDNHKSGRPTKERERVQTGCARKFGEWYSLLDALMTIAKAFGPIHQTTLDDEILEMLDGYNPISFRHRVLEAAKAC